MKSALETIETGKDNICRAENGRAAVEAVIAIHKSARQRKLINFPVEVSEESPVLEGENECAEENLCYPVGENPTCRKVSSHIRTELCTRFGNKLS